MRARFPIDLDAFSVPAQKQLYELFAATVKETPALNGSMVMFEGYSTKGVKAVPADSTAYAFRGDNVVVMPFVAHHVAGEELSEKAREFGEGMRSILKEGSGREELHAYVNYAYGTETGEEMYGSETWRQERLKELKDKYDPQRKFSFYAPIA